MKGLQITGENFIEQLEKGNEKALEYVIDHYGWVLKTVLKKHLFYIMAYYDECMNDCLLAIWENISYYNPKKSSFQNWIGGIAKYKSIDYARKHLKDLENRSIDDVTISAEDNAYQEILAQEVKAEIKKLFEYLSAEDRMVFEKLYFEEKDMNEVAAETGLSKSILYNRVSRGKKRMRNRIEDRGTWK